MLDGHGRKGQREKKVSLSFLVFACEVRAQARCNKLHCTARLASPDLARLLSAPLPSRLPVRPPAYPVLVRGSESALTAPCPSSEDEPQLAEDRKLNSQRGSQPLNSSTPQPRNLPAAGSASGSNSLTYPTHLTGAVNEPTNEPLHCTAPRSINQMSGMNQIARWRQRQEGRRVEWGPVRCGGVECAGRG